MILVQRTIDQRTTNLMQIVDEIEETLRSALPELLAIYRFGSHGTGFERNDSDIDLAVLARQPCDATALWNLGQTLAAKLHRDVDLVDLRSASTVLRAQVVAYGERLSCTDPVECDAYEDYALSAYARLNEERRFITEDILRRGSVHGG